MRTAPSIFRSCRTSLRLALLCAIGIPTSIQAQNLALKVEARGKSSCAIPSYAESFHLHAVQTSTTTGDLVASGGAPGFDVALIVGTQEIQVPVLGAQLHVYPQLFFVYAKFDATGTARYSFPIPKSKGQYFYVQAMQLGTVQQQLVVAMSNSLKVETVATTAATTDWRRTRATMMMQLSFDVYEWTKFGGNGPIKVGQRLIGDFRVLRKIKTPNPKSSSKWFGKLEWPDTQLMVARNSSGDIGVIFRGTDPAKPRDWATDLNYPPQNGFHGGFLLAYGSVAAELGKYLPTVVDPHSRVYFSGHSLGGALSPVAAYHLQPALAKLGVAKNKVITYAFAGPRAMTPTKAKEFATRLPHHFLVANKDDPVTHVPLPVMGYSHIPRMQVLYPFNARIADVGGSYRQIGLTNVLLHPQDKYVKRIKDYLPPPSVSLSVSSGGYMKLHRSWPGRAWGLDEVRLYKGNPLGSGTLSVTKAAILGDGLTTVVPKGSNYYAAYVHAYKTERKIIATWGPYNWGTPKLSMKKTSLNFVEVHWTMKDPGAHDFIALYNKDPRKATLINRLGTAKATKSSRTWTTTRLWKKGLWAAYVERETAVQSGKFVKIIGPTN